MMAQPETATLRGTVMDSSGAPLKDAVLVIADSGASKVVRRVTTRADGTYEVPSLWPGAYQVTIEGTGYRTLVVYGIVLEPGRVRRFDPKLTPGSAVEPLEVHDTGAPALLETGSVSELIDYKDRWIHAPFVDLHPSPLPLLTTAPAIQGNNAGLVISGISARDQQRWAIDGVPDDISTQTGNPSFFQTVEATLANPGAEAARPVHVNMISKRAADTLHGQVYYKRGSSAFNARSYFDRERIPYKLSEAEGELGWPLIPNWTYVFGGGMYQKLPYRQSMYADVPTQKMRSADLSQYLDPQTAPNGRPVVVRDPRTGLPLPGNLIPSNRVSSVAMKYVNNYYPAPNVGDANTFTQNYTWVHRYGPDTYNGNWPFARVDQRVSDRNQMYFRWLQNQTASVAPGSVDRRLSSTQSVRYRSLAASDIHAFSSNVVNQLTLARTRIRVKQGQSEGEIDPMRGDSVVSTLGLEGVNPKGYSAMGFPALSISGLTGLSMIYGGGLERNVARNDGFVTLQDSLTWMIGRHTLKAGVQYTRFSWRHAEVPQTVYGAFTFTGAFTGLAFADFLYGYPATSARQTARLNRLSTQDQSGVFLADTFRVTSRLTLDYGVRWDYYGSPEYDDGYMANWDPATGKVIVAPGTLTAVSAYYPKSIAVVTGEVVPKANTKNVRPRIGAVYRLMDNLVLRGGYGEFTEILGYGPNGRLNSTNPYNLAETYTNSISGGVVALSFPKPFPASPSSTQLPSQNVTGFPARNDEGVIRQYNVTIEGQARGFGLGASYIGSRGAGMNYILDINKPRAGAAPFSVSKNPYPQFAATHVVRNDGEWRYDSLVLRASRRSGPVIFETSFTWANNISNYANTIDPYNVTNQWTRDAANRRLYSVTSVDWPLPVGKGRRFLSGAGPLMNGLLGNWTLRAVATFGSGQYFSPWFTGPDPANASEGFVTQLPDCVGNPNSGARTLARWFDPSAFAIPPASAGRYGTCGMNILEGYPIHVGHLSVAKRIPMGEQAAAVFTAQISNVTNTPHFTFPNNNISNPNPGMFTASSVLGPSSPERLGSRQIDFRLRLEW